MKLEYKKVLTSVGDGAIFEACDRKNGSIFNLLCNLSRIFTLPSNKHEKHTVLPDLRQDQDIFSFQIENVMMAKQFGVTCSTLKSQRFGVSLLLAKETNDETIKVHNGTDHRHLERAPGRTRRVGVAPQARGQRCDLLLPPRPHSALGVRPPAVPCWLRNDET